MGAGRKKTGFGWMLVGGSWLMATDVGAAEPGPAAVDPLQTCVETHDLARKSFEEHVPYFARDALKQCSNDGCPIAIRAECAEWLGQAELQVPTLVFSASIGQSDAERVTVDVDGLRIQESLDGHPIEATPGAHVVVFTLPDGRQQEVRIVVGLGEKNRVVRAEFPTREAKPAETVAVQRPLVSLPSSRVAEANRSRNPAWLFDVLSFGSAVAAGSFLYVGYHQYREREDSCAPNCSAADARKVKRWFYLADIAGATALVTGGLGVYFYFADDDSAKRSGAVIGYQGAF